jgi:hypothetical protein
MTDSNLAQDTITFGKYNGKLLLDVLKDRKYCEWLLKQNWFEEQYLYLYNRINEYKPLLFFIKNNVFDDITDNENDENDENNKNFIKSYLFFNLKNINDIEINLTECEKKCYEYYLFMLNNLKNKIIERLDNPLLNPYDIKAPVKWLQNFEKEYKYTRDDFKTFLSSYELPNIPYIIEDIKKEGGLIYNGAQSFNIAKKRSLEQEKHWEFILKDKYNENIGTQFKYDNCIFDFININTNTIYECKLGLKDFNDEQHKKYRLILNKYNIIYIIGYDAIIFISLGKIYTINTEKYIEYINIVKNKILTDINYNPSPFDYIIKDFDIIYIDNLNTIL